jgi:hypothetical protein
MGTLKLIAGFVVIAAVVYGSSVLIPPFFSNYQFEDAIETEARMSTYSTKPEDAIRESVFKKAQDLEIPIAKEQIKVQRFGYQGTGSILIETQYTVHVDLPGYPLDLNFHPTTKNRGAF